MGLSRLVQCELGLLSIAGADPLRSAFPPAEMGFAQDRVGLGLGGPGEQEHSNKMACCKQGPDGDGFEETHGCL